MGRLTRVDRVFLASAGLLWFVLGAWTSRPWVDRFFTAVVLTCLLALLRIGVLAWLSARDARRRDAEVRRSYPDEAARRAVADERSRLSTEIVHSLRSMLVEVAAEARAVVDAGDPVPGLQRIQLLARRATSDLRRQLGLLREPDADLPRPVTGTTHGDRPSRGDLRLAAAMSSLAAVEVTAYLVTEGFGEGYGEGFAGGLAVPACVALSMVAAASIVLRRVAPVAGALWCAGAFGVGFLIGAPVGGGFWAVGTVGALVWSLAAAAPAVAGLLAWVVLAASIVGSRLADDQDNAFVFGLLIAVVSVVGLVVRLSRGRDQRALDRAREHEQVLRVAAERAVRQERQQFAREIHDVVSHAVGLVAMQAAAAEVSLPGDRSTFRRALEVIVATAESTLEEMDRLVPGASTGPDQRVPDLVRRIRAGGTDVRWAQDGQVDPALEPVVYRIVQEGLTNAVRHAPGAPVRVEVSARPDALVVVVQDDGPGADQARRSGYGLVGITERVELLGGTVSAGAGTGGRGFRLQAVVPRVDARVAP